MQDQNTENNEKTQEKDEFKKILEKNKKIITVPKIGDLITGSVLSISKHEVRLDIDGMTTGLVRAQELYNDLEEYSKLKEGDLVDATVLEVDNETGEMELSFRVAGQQKTWGKINDAYKNKKIVKAIVKEANKGGLIVKMFSIETFLPVSHLAPEHYPKVLGGDKTKILEKLRKIIGEEINVKIMDVSEKDQTIIVSEKAALSEIQNEIISNFKIGDIVEGAISAITDFGAFIKIDTKIIDDKNTEKVNFAEGLIHISEIAWQKIDNLKNYLKEDKRVKAKIININGAKIFLSIKDLLKNPWLKIKDTYSIGQKVKGTILKINPFGIFVGLEKDIQGLAHISELSPEKNLKTIEDIEKIVKIGEKKEFTIVSIDTDNHKIGLSSEGLIDSEKNIKKKEDKKIAITDDDQKSEKKKEKTKKSTKIKKTENKK
ncbi:30S ribosomal protein S1 [Patescibacteria group bacterium]